MIHSLPKVQISKKKVHLIQQSVSVNRNMAQNAGRILKHDSLVSPLALAETGLHRMVSYDVDRHIAMAEIADTWLEAELD